MTTHNEPSIARRPFLKGAGVTLATLGGMTGSAVANGEPTPLTDKAADIIVYWSEVDDHRRDPNSPSDFGFPGPSNPMPPGGITFAGNDPAGGGLFDFSRIRMLPNGDLTNTWLLFAGAVLATPPVVYELEHLGGGLYESRGQDMDFTARPASSIKAILGMEALPPALAKLAGNEWHAVGREYAKLGLDGGDPDPTAPEWGATRIDLYERESMEYGLSLLYVIVADSTPDPFDSLRGSRGARGTATALIARGRLPLEGRRRGKRG